MALAEAADAPGECAGGVAGVVEGALVECVVEEGGGVVAGCFGFGEDGGEGVEGGVGEDAFGAPMRNGADSRLSTVRLKRAARIKGEQPDETTSILDQRHARRLLSSRGRAPAGRGVDALLGR